MKKHLHLILASLVLLCGTLTLTTGCATTSGEKPTPQASAFTTLKASAAAIDAYRAQVEQARAAGAISDAQWAEFRKTYNTANWAIRDAAILLRDVGGMDASSPESVNAAVVALTDLVVKLIPPKR